MSDALPGKMVAVEEMTDAGWAPMDPHPVKQPNCSAALEEAHAGSETPVASLPTAPSAPGGVPPPGETTQQKLDRELLERILLNEAIIDGTWAPLEPPTHLDGKELPMEAPSQSTLVAGRKKPARSQVRPPGMQPQMPAESPLNFENICFRWARGYCAWGRRCRFQHPPKYELLREINWEARHQAAMIKAKARKAPLACYRPAASATGAPRQPTTPPRRRKREDANEAGTMAAASSCSAPQKPKKSWLASAPWRQATSPTQPPPIPEPEGPPRGSQVGVMGGPRKQGLAPETQKEAQGEAHLVGAHAKIPDTPPELLEPMGAAPPAEEQRRGRSQEPWPPEPDLQKDKEAAPAQDDANEAAPSRGPDKRARSQHRSRRQRRRSRRRSRRPSRPRHRTRSRRRTSTEHDPLAQQAGASGQASGSAMALPNTETQDATRADLARRMVEIHAERQELRRNYPQLGPAPRDLSPESMDMLLAAAAKSTRERLGDMTGASRDGPSGSRVPPNAWMAQLLQLNRLAFMSASLLQSHITPS